VYPNLNLIIDLITANIIQVSESTQVGILNLIWSLLMLLKAPPEMFIWVPAEKLILESANEGIGCKLSVVATEKTSLRETCV
jgi:hypothetical protein